MAVVQVASSLGVIPRSRIAINRAEACSSPTDPAVKFSMNHRICSVLSSPPSRLVPMTSRIVTLAMVLRVGSVRTGRDVARSERVG